MPERHLAHDIGEGRLGGIHHAAGTRPLDGGDVRAEERRRHDVGQRTFGFRLLRFGLHQRGRRRRQGHRDLVLAQDEVIAVLELYNLVAVDALLGVVEEDTVGAGVGQEIAAALVMDGAVLAGQDAFRVLQDPIVLGRAADTDGSVIEELGGFLTRREPLIASDGQFQGHGANPSRMMPL